MYAELSNGKYTYILKTNGDEIILDGSLTLNDLSSPITDLITTVTTTDSITAIVTAHEQDAGLIDKYYFSIDGDNYTESITNSYKFNNLTSNTTYTIYVKASNKSGLKSDVSTKSVKTKTITNPTIIEDSKIPVSGYNYSSKKVIKITYSDVNINNPIYYFKSSVSATVPVGVVIESCGTGTTTGTCTTSSITTLVANTWYKATSGNPSITYNQNGTLYALTSDGTNISGSSSYEISKIDTGIPTAPTLTGGSTAWSITNRTISVSAPSTSSTTQSGGSWTNCITSQTITTNGTRYIYFRAINNAGTIGTVSAPQVTVIDTSSPTVTVSVSGKTATFTITDNLGVSAYGVNQSSTVAPGYTMFGSTTSTTKSWTASDAGTYYVWVKDNSGRAVNKSFTIASSAFSYLATPTCTGSRNYVNGQCLYTYTNNEEKCGCETYNECQNSACGTKEDCVQLNYYWEFKCDNRETCIGGPTGGLPDYCCNEKDGSVGQITRQWASCIKYQTVNVSCATSACGCKTAKSCTIVENDYLSYTCPNGGTVSGTLCVFN